MICYIKTQGERYRNWPDMLRKADAGSQGAIEEILETLECHTLGPAGEIDGGLERDLYGKLESDHLNGIFDELAQLILLGDYAQAGVIMEEFIQAGNELADELGDPEPEESFYQGQNAYEPVRA